ncbi:MAG: MBL fold metallo-hydrolase [Candidatus Neomarinimicrobiota bacterium]|nr:MBL fold metallo-hydrolase [Candidatus Neomarinimicrobiota bacterium]
MLNVIGEWKVSSLETGDFRLDGGAMMGSVPKVLWEKTNPADSLNRIDLSLRCLLLEKGSNKILIETGMGNKLTSNFIQRFNVNQSKHPLKDRLEEIGLHIEDITHVILTHLHFDHAGGATTLNDDNLLVPTFPNAKYYISKKNWSAGFNPSPRDSASYLKINYEPLEKIGKIILLDDNVEIIDGISTMVVNGHTEGQQLIKINGNGDSLVFCSDLIPLKSHIQLPWIMGYDLNAVLTLKEKEEFLNEAVEKKWWLWFYHDPSTIAVKIDYGKKYYEIIDEIKRENINAK